MRLQPILDQIVATAARLCRSDSCFVYLAEGELLRMRANIGQPQKVVEYERLHPDRPGPGSCTGRVALTKKPVHIPDVTADPEYDLPEITTMGNIRTTLSVPLLRNGVVIGTLNLGHERVEPLMAAFADQSAIAIASWLFETVEQQKAELSRFLSPRWRRSSRASRARNCAGHRGYITVVYFDLRLHSVHRDG
jgi:GAF domain-containing protein